MSLRFLVPLLALAAVLGTSAAECVPTRSDGAPDLSEQTLTVAAGDVGTFYVTNDVCQLIRGGQPCFWAVHVYEESNGLDGLQRRDHYDWDDACGLPADTLVEYTDA